MGQRRVKIRDAVIFDYDSCERILETHAKNSTVVLCSKYELDINNIK